MSKIRLTDGFHSAVKQLLFLTPEQQIQCRRLHFGSGSSPGADLGPIRDLPYRAEWHFLSAVQVDSTNPPTRLPKLGCTTIRRCNFNADLG